MMSISKTTPSQSKLPREIEQSVAGCDVVDIYDIQNQVEDLLMRSQYSNAARKYIEYRKSRDIERESPQRTEPRYPEHYQPG